MLLLSEVCHHATALLPRSSRMRIMVSTSMRRRNFFARWSWLGSTKTMTIYKKQRLTTAEALFEGKRLSTYPAMLDPPNTNGAKAVCHSTSVILGKLWTSCCAVITTCSCPPWWYLRGPDWQSWKNARVRNSLTGCHLCLERCCQI